MTAVFFDRVGPLAMGSRLRQLSEQFSDESRKAYKFYGVPIEPNWFPVFRTLADEGYGLSTSDLAERIGHTHASVSQITAAMSRAGLIESTRSEEDGRVNVIQLSPEGTRLVPVVSQLCDYVSEAIKELLAESGQNLWTAVAEIEALLEQRGLFERIKEHHRLQEAEHVCIVRFSPEHSEAFRSLNLAWIEQFFTVEESDQRMLDDPVGQIIKKGGTILMASYRGDIVGTCGLISRGGERFELAKMAVAEGVRGKGIGLLLGQAVLTRARMLGAQSVYIETNTMLEPAIALYRKLGFRQIFGSPSPYSRCNIQMEIAIDALDGQPPRED